MTTLEQMIDHDWSDYFNIACDQETKEITGISIVQLMTDTISWVHYRGDELEKDYVY